jgi:hypothetical protein
MTDRGRDGWLTFGCLLYNNNVAVIRDTGNEHNKHSGKFEQNMKHVYILQESRKQLCDYF